MSDSQLLERAKAGALSAREVEDVAKALLSSAEGRDPYTLIHILGRSGAMMHRDLVARHLESPSDPMLARIALQVLCSHWQLAAEYVEWIKRFIAGVRWDPDEDVRLVAISEAGELLRSSPTADLKRMLFQVFIDTRQSQISRQAAYFALARASGKAWSDLPPASRVLDLESGTDPGVLAWASADEEATNP